MNDLKTLINSLDSANYRKGVVGVYLDLEARDEFLYQLTLKKNSFCKSKGEAFINQWSKNPANAADIREIHLSSQQILRELKYDRQKITYYLARLDKNNAIDQPSEIAREARSFLSLKTVKYYRGITGTESETWVDDIAQELRDKLRRKRVHDLRTRIINEVETAAENGWFVVFNSLTLAPHQIEAFESSENVIRDHMRNLGRAVNENLGIPKSQPYTDNFKYICVPELGGKNGRLHFHTLCFFRALPKGCMDPNQGANVPLKREITALKRFWPAGFSAPIACRFSLDAYTTKLNWKWPVARTGDDVEPIKSLPPVAVAHYLTKYVRKNSDEGMTLCPTTKRNYRIRMSRNFGLNLMEMTHLTTNALQQLSRIHYSAHPQTTLIRMKSQRLLRQRLGRVSLLSFLNLRMSQMNLLQRMRTLTSQNCNPKALNFTDSHRIPLKIADISDEARWYLRNLPDYGGVAVAR